MINDGMSGPIILLTVDSLRADYCSSETLPQSWEHFEQDFLQFQNAFANGVATMLSFPGILSGEIVNDGGGIHPNVGTIANNINSRTWAYTNNPWLTRAYHYDRGFDHFTSREDIEEDQEGPVRKLKNVLGNYEIIRYLHTNLIEIYSTIFDNSYNNKISYGHKQADFLFDKLREEIEETGLYWAHLMDPHWPYLPEKTLKENTLDHSINSYDRIREANNRFKNLDPTSDDIDILTKLYRGQIGFVDHHLNQFLSYLKQQGLYEESMIIFVSDHGDLFGEEGYYYHNRKQIIPLDGVVRIPLFIKFPQEKYGGQTRNHLVQHSDIRSTIDKYYGLTQSQDGGLLTPVTEPIISFSDRHVRATDENGYAIANEEDIIKITGSPNESTIESALDTSPPSVPFTHNPDWSTTDRELVEEQLEALGYK